MSHVFHRSLTQGYPTAVKGDGPYLIDAQGGATWMPAVAPRSPAWGTAMPPSSRPSASR